MLSCKVVRMLPARECALTVHQVGVIVAVKRHPGADTLYVEDIDLGEGKPRQVVSGLVGKVALEELVGTKLVCVCNLKPANMRGVRSEAMVLAATSTQGDKVRQLYMCGVP